MKYYSEKLNRLFDSVESLNKAEEKALRAEEEKRIAEEEKKKAEILFEQNKQISLEDLQNAYDTFYNKLKDHVGKYGSLGINTSTNLMFFPDEDDFPFGFMRF